MEVKQKIDILSYALHESTESELIEALAQEADEVFYPKKSKILGMGEPQRYVYLIILPDSLQTVLLTYSEGLPELFRRVSLNVKESLSRHGS